MILLPLVQVLDDYILHILNMVSWEVYTIVRLKIVVGRCIRPRNLLIIFITSIELEELLKLLLDVSRLVGIKLLRQEPHSEVLGLYFFVREVRDGVRC